MREEMLVRDPVDGPGSKGTLQAAGADPRVALGHTAMDPTDFLITLAFSVGVVSIAGADLLRRHLRSQLGKLGLKREGDAYRGVIDGVAVEVPIGAHPSSPLKVIVRPFTAVEFIGPHAVRPFGPIVLTGDVEFDRGLAACGDEVVVRGTLDGDTRSGIRRSGIVVRYGQLEGEFLSLEHAESIVRFAVSLHRRAHCAPEERPAQLDENARRDSSPAGLRCLTTLARMPGGVARAAAIAHDGSLEGAVRLHAAIIAGAEDVLASIAATTGDGDRLAAATGALGSIGSSELASALDRVRQFLRANPNESLVRVLGRYGIVDDVPLLGSVDGGGLHWAIRDAIRAIQGRIVGADDGALAIAEAVGGEMAVADDGGLSVTRTETEDPPS